MVFSVFVCICFFWVCVVCCLLLFIFFFFFSSRRRHTRLTCDWSSDVCSSDLAAILLYTLAPDLLLGWPRANRPEECAYMLADICTRPEVGRITGRGNTANLESVIALKPDLILDVGSTSATFVSLAERVQQQTGIPYALLDGRFDGIAATYRKLGELVGRQNDAEKLARYADNTLKTITGRI